ETSRVSDWVAISTLCLAGPHPEGVGGMVGGVLQGPARTSNGGWAAGGSVKLMSAGLKGRLVQPCWTSPRLLRLVLGGQDPAVQSRVAPPGAACGTVPGAPVTEAMVAAPGLVPSTSLSVRTGTVQGPVM